MTHVLFRSVLLNLPVFWHFPDIFLLLISGLIPLRSESYDFYFLNVYKCVLWLRMQSILNVLTKIKRIG